MYVCLMCVFSVRMCVSVFVRVCVHAHLIYLIYIDTSLYEAISSPSFQPTKSNTTVSLITVSIIIPGKLLCRAVILYIYCSNFKYNVNDHFPALC